MTHRNRHARTRHNWNCIRCNKLLGRIIDTRVQILVSRSHQYLVSAPVTSVCRCCGTLNELGKLP